MLAVPKGEYLLSNGANSSLGHQIIALGRHYGVKTINVVRHKEAVQELKDAGYEHPLTQSAQCRRFQP